MVCWKQRVALCRNRLTPHTPETLFPKFAITRFGFKRDCLNVCKRVSLQYRPYAVIGGCKSSGSLFYVARLPLHLAERAHSGCLPSLLRLTLCLPVRLAPQRVLCRRMHDWFNLDAIVSRLNPRPHVSDMQTRLMASLS